MNEVFEMVAEVLEELRSEAGEREYSVCTKEAKNAAKELKKANQEYEKLLAEISGEQRELLEKYMDIVDHAHFQELFRNNPEKIEIFLLFCFMGFICTKIGFHKCKDGGYLIGSTF